MPRGIRLVLVLSYATALRFPHYTPHNGKRCARRDFGMICTASLVGATKAQAAQASPPIVVPRERLMQFENMCHLNVHMLLSAMVADGKAAAAAGGDGKVDQLFAVVISSPHTSGPEDPRPIKLWEQQSGLKEWDFHVLAVVRDDGGGAYFLDVESALPEWPVPAASWAARALHVPPPPGDAAAGGSPRMYRVVPAGDYVSNLRSTGERANLMTEFVSMDPSRGFGTVMNEADFLQWAGAQA